MDDSVPQSRYLQLSHESIAWPTNSSLYVPAILNVDVLNPSSQPRRIEKIMCEQPQIQATDFKPVTVPPRHSVSVPLVYLPTEVGRINTTVVFQTDAGVLETRAIGAGVPSAWRIPNMTNITVPVDTRVLTPVRFYNPLSRKVNIKEAFSTQRIFHLSLPGQNPGVVSVDRWEIEPGLTRRVIDVSFISSVAGLFVGYLHVITNVQTFVIPIQVRVVEESYLVRPSSLAFGTLTRRGQTRARTIELRNIGLEPIAVVRTQHSTSHPKLVKFRVKWNNGSTVTPISSKRATVTLTLRGSRNANVTGMLTLVAADGARIAIPYRVFIFQGTLAYTRDSVFFRVPPPADKLNAPSLPEGCPPDGSAVNEVVITNRFPRPVAVKAVELDRNGFSVLGGFEPRVALPGEQWTLCKVRFLADDSKFGKSRHQFMSSLKVTTNVSVFHLGVQAFTGHARVVWSDVGGAAPNATYPSPVQTKQVEPEFRLLPDSTTEVNYTVFNPNPVVMRVKAVRTSSEDVTARFAAADMVDASTKTLSAESPPQGTLLTLQPGDSTQLTVTITARSESPPSTSNVTITTDLPFFDEHPCPSARRAATLSFPVRSRVATDALRWNGAAVHLVPSYQSMAGLATARITNRFAHPVRVANAQVCDARRCGADPRFKVRQLAGEIPPGKPLDVAEVMFEPTSAELDERTRRLLVADKTGRPSAEEMEAVAAARRVWVEAGTALEGMRLEVSVESTGDANVVVASVPLAVAPERAQGVLLSRDLDFGPVQVGSSRGLFVRVSNPTNLPLSVSLVESPQVGASTRAEAVSGAFTVTGARDAVLRPGASAKLGPVVFTPDSKSDFRRAVYIRNNSTKLSRLELTGSGVARLICLELAPRGEGSAQADPSCAKSVSIDAEAAAPARDWILYVRNRGSTDTVVTGFAVGSDSCTGPASQPTTYNRRKPHCKSLPARVPAGGATAIAITSRILFQTHRGGIGEPLQVSATTSTGEHRLSIVVVQSSGVLGAVFNALFPSSWVGLVIHIIPAIFAVAWYMGRLHFFKQVLATGLEVIRSLQAGASTLKAEPKSKRPQQSSAVQAKPKPARSDPVAASSPPKVKGAAATAAAAAAAAAVEAEVARREAKEVARKARRKERRQKQKASKQSRQVAAAANAAKSQPPSKPPSQSQPQPQPRPVPASASSPDVADATTSEAGAEKAAEKAAERAPDPAPASDEVSGETDGFELPHRRRRRRSRDKPKRTTAAGEKEQPSKRSNSAGKAKSAGDDSAISVGQSKGKGPQDCAPLPKDGVQAGSDRRRGDKSSDPRSAKPASKKPYSDGSGESKERGAPRASSDPSSSPKSKAEDAPKRKSFDLANSQQQQQERWLAPGKHSTPPPAVGLRSFGMDNGVSPALGRRQPSVFNATPGHRSLPDWGSGSGLLGLGRTTKMPSTATQNKPTPIGGGFGSRSRTESQDSVIIMQPRLGGLGDLLPRAAPPSGPAPLRLRKDVGAGVGMEMPSGSGVTPPPGLRLGQNSSLPFLPPGLGTGAGGRAAPADRKSMLPFGPNTNAGVKPTQWGSGPSGPAAPWLPSSGAVGVGRSWAAPAAPVRPAAAPPASDKPHSAARSEDYEPFARPGYFSQSSFDKDEGVPRR